MGVILSTCWGIGNGGQEWVIGPVAIAVPSNSADAG